YRASVPPRPRDSSSGWASTASSRSGSSMREHGGSTGRRKGPTRALSLSHRGRRYIRVMNSAPRSDDDPVTRAGHVALVGRPNAGKSTLLNALVGEKLSIVTSKAQTTRESVTGLLTTERAQAIFVDTPGLLEAKYTLQRAMQETALEVIEDADLVLLLLDGTRPA